MLIVKSVFFGFDKLVNIDKIILHERVKLINQLKMMDIFYFLVACLLHFEKNDELHDQLLYFLVEFQNGRSILEIIFCIKVVGCHYFCDNKLDDLVVRVDEVVGTQLIGYFQNLGSDERIVFEQQRFIVVLEHVIQNVFSFLAIFEIGKIGVRKLILTYHEVVMYLFQYFKYNVQKVSFLVER